MAGNDMEKGAAAKKHCIIDIHSHAIPQRLPPPPGETSNTWPSVEVAGEAGTILVGGRFFRSIGSECWSARRRIEALDRDGVVAQLVSPVPVTFCYDAPPHDAAILAELQNDFLSGQVVDGGGRLAGLGAVPLQDPELAAKELSRCVSQLGLLGAEIGTVVGPTELWDPRFEPFFAVAEELAAVLYLHPGVLPAQARLEVAGMAFGVGMPCETAIAAAGMIMGGLLERHPRLRIVLAHGGGALPMVLPRLDMGWELAGGAERTGLPMRPSEYARRFYTDTLTYDAGSLRLALDRFGIDHVMIGTDYPFAARDRAPGASLDKLDLGEAETETIAFANVVELLGVAWNGLERALARWEAQPG